MSATWTPPTGDVSTSGNGTDTAEPGAIADAAAAVAELQGCVELLARRLAGGSRSRAYVLAGRTSALLAAADAAAAGHGEAARRRVSGLRSDYEAALLRLGEPAAEPAPARRQGLVIDLTAVSQGGLRGAIRSVATALAVMGVLLLCFAVYTIGFGHLTYERHQRIMLDQLTKEIKQSAAIAAAAVEGDRNLGAAPERGKPIALLEIPALKLREVVVQGTGTRELRSAVGHYRPSPMPGQAGNAVLAGHRNLYGRPFADLGKLKAGDDIVVTTQEGRFTYKLEKTETASTGQQDFLSQGTFVNRLTLLTTSGEKGGRFAAIAKLEGKAGALTIKDTSKFKSDELGLGRDSSGWWPSLGWGLAMLATLVLALTLYKRWRRLSTHLITTAPLVAIGLLWFESVARLIPSTF